MRGARVRVIAVIRECRTVGLGVGVPSNGHPGKSEVTPCFAQTSWIAQVL